MLKHIFLIIILFPCLIFATEKRKLNNDIIVTPKEEKYFGDDNVKPSLHKIYSKEIALVERYLNEYHTFVAKFKQSGTKGDISYGKLFVSKPNKIRCEYSNPSPLLLIMNENKITYYDKELDEISYTNYDINALKFLALEEIKFSKLNLVAATKEDGFVSFSVKEYSNDLKQDLIVTFTFSYPKIKLTRMLVTMEDSESEVIFSNITFNQVLGKQLFYFNRTKPKA